TSTTVTTTGPAQTGPGRHTSDSATAATVHTAIGTTPCVPATSAPKPLPGAAATPRRHATTTATRPEKTAKATAHHASASASAPNEAACRPRTTTSAATPKGPAPPLCITSRARSGGP